MAAGPDGISPIVLWELSSVIAPALQKIFSKSLSSHQVPEDWKKAFVTPIFKKGDKDSPANYRPISLTCICSKLLEHIITKSIMSHLEHHNLLCHLQHGFRRFKWCESQLIEFVTDIVDNSHAKQTDIIILDFSKAFDKIPHNRSLYKLENYGIRCYTLKWMKAFLENQEQCIVVNGERSDFVALLSGVPQGSS